MKHMSEYEYMVNGFLFNDFDKKTRKIRKKHDKFLDAFNSTGYGDYKKRAKLARKYFKKVGKRICINKPFYCDMASNITIGDNFYSNFNLTILDNAPVTIGNNVFIGPNVSLFTSGHPIDKDIRNSYYEFAHKIVIGNDVWIGGNVVINPGVTIGDNVVIGSGSVVTKDIPSNVVAVGNPCHVLRQITVKDKKFWENEIKRRDQAIGK